MYAKVALRPNAQNVGKSSIKGGVMSRSMEDIWRDETFKLRAEVERLKHPTLQEMLEKEIKDLKAERAAFFKADINQAENVIDVVERLKAAELQIGELLKALKLAFGKVPIMNIDTEDAVWINGLLLKHSTNDTCNCRAPEGEGHHRDCPASGDDGISNCTCNKEKFDRETHGKCPVHYPPEA